jgi:hypothetical protein
MAKAKESVEHFMQRLNHPLKAEIERIRAIILKADGQITEQIKWNAPSFCYHGDDRVTMRIQPQEQIQLIFHRGAKVRSDSADFKFEDGSGLMKWATSDRGVVTLRTMQDVEVNEMALTTLVREWMKATI